MKKIIAATGNENKIKEINEILGSLGLRVLSMKQQGLPPMDIEETGTTFDENAQLKARAVAEVSGETALAEDSGLVVEALGGAPGIYSARFAGIHGDDRANNIKLLKEMEGIPFHQRKAKFVCAISLVHPDGRSLSARGEVSGSIAEEMRGHNGFGYDCLFIPQGHRQTFGELDAEIKNNMSHRKSALEMLNRLILGEQ